MHIGLLNNTEFPDLIGRVFANNGFLNAIKRYNGGHEISVFETSLISKDQLEFIKRKPLNVLHYPGPSLYKAMEFKRFNPEPLVTTGITHSLVGSPYMEFLILNLMAKPSLTDVLFCTSRAVLNAVNEMQKIIFNSSKRSSFFDGILNCSIQRLGIDTKQFFKKEKNSDEKNLLYFGRFCPYTKVNLVPLIRMLKKVISNTSKKVSITFAGAEKFEYVKFLKEICEQIDLKIHFETNVTEQRKIELFSEADIFLAPSNNAQESFGLTLLEALASGLPVVGYDWSGYRDIVEDGKNGFLAKTKLNLKEEILPFKLDHLNQNDFSNSVCVDESYFVKSILSLIENEALLNFMSRRALKSASKFDWENVIPEFIQKWENLNSNCKQTVSCLAPIDYAKVFSHFASKEKNESF